MKNKNMNTQKIRAWDKADKRMIPYEDLIESNWRLADLAKNRYYDLFYSIGVTDKNGVEIYYGDIVKAPDGIWEVIRTEPWDGVAIALDNDQTLEMSCDFADNIFALNEVEVIGNIKENKKLLKKKND